MFGWFKGPTLFGKPIRKFRIHLDQVDDGIISILDRETSERRTYNLVVSRPSHKLTIHNWPVRCDANMPEALFVTGVYVDGNKIVRARSYDIESGVVEAYDADLNLITLTGEVTATIVVSEEDWLYKQVPVGVLK